VIVELQGLEVFGYHGVHAREQEEGQVFLFDIRLEVGARGTSDRIDEAIDYTQVASAVCALSDTRRFNLLEALASAVAEMLLERFEPERVRVRVRKPEVRPAGLTVEWSAVTVELP